MATNCEVVKKSSTAKSFEKHLKYKNIRKKYNNDGQRREALCLGNKSFLCPTLMEYTNSGLT